MATLVLLALLAQQDLDRPPRSDRLGAHPRLIFWQPNLNGTMVADEGISPSVGGSRISLDGDLDIDDDDDVIPVFELGLFETFHQGGHSAEIERFTLSFWSHQWQGSTRLDQSETFNGSVYPAGTAVDSRFRVGVLGLDSLVFAAGIPGSNIDGGFTLGLRIIDVKGAMDGAADHAERTRLLYLGGGFRGEWHPAPFLYGAAWASIYFSYGDIADEVIVDFETWGAIDVEGAVSLGMEWGPMRAEIGLRFISNAFDIARDDSSASEETEFSFFAGGPYLQFSFRF